MKFLKTHTTACTILSKRGLFVARIALFVAAALLLSNCATGNAKIASRQGHDRSVEKTQTQTTKSGKKKKTAAIGTTFEGEASYYGPGFDGKKTASGEIFNQNDFTCAHKKLPFGTVNDRGPFAKGRVLDLSAAAGKKLGLEKVGHAKVTATVVE